MRTSKLWIWGILGILMLQTACKKDPPPETVVVTYDDTPYQLAYGDFPPPPIPDDNQLTRQGVQLGRMLFYDTRLSLDGSQSCASCHLQDYGFSDSARFSIGVEGLPGKRQAMAAVNLAWNSNEFFWDGRAHLLRDQVLMPIEDPLEMNEVLAAVVAKLEADTMYTNQFIRAFGDSEVTTVRMALALEQFLFSIVSTESKYDRFLRGQVTLTPEEERGRELFFAEYNPFFPAVSGADCQHCHSGKNFENDKYLNNGLDSDADMTDLGREDVTGNPNDKGKFKVTSLRNIELTAPYMHDGRFQTLEEVVDHYDHGLQPSSTLDITLENTRVTGLMLTAQDKAALVAFLKTLTDPSLATNPAYSSPF